MNQQAAYQLRNITFTFCRADGTNSPFTKDIIGDDEMVEWATQQYAEVNECGVIAEFNGKQIAIAGNVQQ